MSDNQTLRILVGLDELFDVRLAILLEMDEGYPEIALKNGYLIRKSDDFSTLIPNFDVEKYNALYEKRSFLHIANTRITNLIYLLRNLFVEADQKIQERPFAFKKELWINIHPFVFSEEEKTIIKNCIDMHLNTKIVIEIIDMELETLTPMFIKNNFSNVALYEFNKWMVIHHDKLIEHPMPTVSFTVPHLVLPGKDPDATLSIPNIGKLSATALVQLNYAQFVNITFEDIMTFCINIPIHAPKTNE